MHISDWSSVVCSSDLLAPCIASYDPVQVSFTAIRKAPSAAHWFGTDELGRDIFSRMVFGARASLMAGMFSVLIALAVGVPFGLLAGYFGGLVDGCISRDRKSTRLNSSH